MAGTSLTHRTTKAAIYARVSTSNNGQSPEMQLRELREYCQRQGGPSLENTWTRGSQILGSGGRNWINWRPTPTGGDSMRSRFGSSTASPAQFLTCFVPSRLSRPSESTPFPCRSKWTPARPPARWFSRYWVLSRSLGAISLPVGSMPASGMRGPTARGSEGRESPWTPPELRPYAPRGTPGVRSAEKQASPRGRHSGPPTACLRSLCL